MNVLLISHAAVIGGASRSLSVVVRQLVRAECGVILLSPAGPMCDEWQGLGARVIRWDPPFCLWLGSYVVSSSGARLDLNNLFYQSAELLKLPGRLRRAVKIIREVIEREQIAVVYVNSLVLFPIASGLTVARRRSSLRVLWQVREVLNDGLVSPLYSLIVSRIVRASDVVIAISSNEAQAFQKAAHVEIVHNPVPEAWMQAPDTAYNTQRLRVIMACAFSADKGIADFITMARTVSSGFPDVDFELFTTYPGIERGSISKILKLASAWNNRVSLVTQFMTGISMLRLDERISVTFGQRLDLRTYQEAAVCVRADHAGCPWGRDVIEAMWAGIPVVATGSSQEFVLDGQTGYLVPPRRPDLLADCVSRLLMSDCLRRELSANARKRARQLFSPDVYYSRILKLFDIGTAPR